MFNQMLVFVSQCFWYMLDMELKLVNGLGAPSSLQTNLIRWRWWWWRCTPHMAICVAGVSLVQ
jgi:hypothetical protein